MDTQPSVIRRLIRAGLVVGFLPALAIADQYDAPTNYYNNATGTGATLKGQLRTIISNAVDRSYDSARQALAITDRDPNNPSNVLLVYNRASVSGAWDGGNTWNREHIWPQSLLNGADDSDYFNLRPSNPSINSSRGNKGFGTTSTPASASYGSQGTLYYPGSPDRGDVARSLFYMATRYSSNLTLVNGAPGAGQMGDLASLLKWHYEDVPDTFERRRNQEIYSNSTNSSYSQGNRNPYVDRPEYAWSVFGDGANDSKLYVGSANPGNGTSSQTVDLGRVMRNAAAPAAQSITLNKAGADPTYFEVTTTGNATSSITGRFNAFGYNVQTRTMQVGLNAGTSSTGLKSGTVTIDNLDITTSGTGTGSNDGNDTIVAQYAVLDKRQVQASTVSMGRVIVGANVTAAASLSTSGDDNSRTRVNVATTSSTDANGVRVSGGSGTLFNGSGSTGGRTLSANFATPGNKGGSLQLPVTSAEVGLGEGAYTPVGVAYTAAALAHSKASFSSSTAVNELTIDFGEVSHNAAVSAQAFSITNLDAFAGFTAGLELDAIYAPSAPMPFSYDLSTFGGTSMLAAGSTLNFNAMLDTAVPGTYSGTYLLYFSDEDLPGAQGGQVLSLTLQGQVTIPEPSVFGLLAIGGLLCRRTRR